MKTASLGLFALLALAACATAPASAPQAFAPPPELRGCWIERRAEQTVAMRWFVTGPERWSGALSVQPKSGGALTSEMVLEKQADRWVYCGLPAPNEAEAQTACQPVGSVVTLAASSNRLTIRDMRRPQALVFNGAREACG